MRVLAQNQLILLRNDFFGYYRPRLRRFFLSRLCLFSRKLSSYIINQKELLMGEAIRMHLFK